MGVTKSKWRGGQLAFYDGTTYETVKPLAPTILYDDFLGTALNGDFWTAADTGAGAVTQAASNMILTTNVGGATDENGVYGSDDKAWNADKGFIFEARLKMTVAPTIGTEIILGVQNDNWTAGANRKLVANEAAICAFFGFYTTVGAGLVAVIRTDDASNDSGVISTGVTSVIGTYQVFRIDFTNVADVKFYIDGVNVCSTTTFNMSNGANIMFQPIVVAQKVGVDAGLGILYLDYIRVWQPTR
jgi:hypothetical protein